MPFVGFPTGVNGMSTWRYFLVIASAGNWDGVKLSAGVFKNVQATPSDQLGIIFWYP